MRPNDASQDDERHGGHGHHSVVEEIVLVQEPNLVSQQRGRTEKLADETYDHQNPSVAQTVADAVQERFPRPVHHGKGFKTSHENAVGDNQADIDRQLHTHIVSVGFEEHAHYRNECGDDYELNDDADARGNGVADERNDDIRKRRDDGHREAHHDGGLKLGGNGQCGADTQHLRYNGVVKIERSCEYLFVLLRKKTHICCPPFLFVIGNKVVLVRG